MSKKEVVYLNTHRTGYSAASCGETLTVEELIEILEQYEPGTPVYFNNDNGYTYGNISEDDISIDYVDIED